MKRFTRLQTIPEKEKKELEKITRETKGFSHYGNRARVALMLELKHAKYISEQAKKQKKSPNEIINQIIISYFEIIGE